MSDTEVLFIEHETEEVSDKAHCGGCFNPEEPGSVEVTDKPHCGDC
ncbi:MAG: hypothetical protein ACYC8T_22410 [Myxococcaceae bacterium]